VKALAADFDNSTMRLAHSDKLGIRGTFRNLFEQIFVIRKLKLPGSFCFEEWVEDLEDSRFGSQFELHCHQTAVEIVEEG
jgi:hypothetical protein